MSEPRDPDDEPLDPVEEADEESFPASDPPARATPGPHRKDEKPLNVPLGRHGPACPGHP